MLIGFFFKSDSVCFYLKILHKDLENSILNYILEYEFKVNFYFSSVLIDL
jgi:hypothetical protein